MRRDAQKWPTHALENLEDSLYRLKQLEAKADRAQDAIVAGDALSAMNELSDVRVLALQCVDNLVRSRLGKYQQQERTPQWTRPAAVEEQTTKVVNQIVATRRP